jgi:hypothetical protein
MNLTTEFHHLMRERRLFAAGSPDHAYRTRAARKIVWLMRGVPASEWVQ